MPSLIAALQFASTHRKIWKGPIVVMLVIAGTLFGVAMGARVAPAIYALL